MSAVALLLALVVAAAPPVADREAMRQADARLGAIGYRLLTANAALCRDRAPATGLILHALGQYPAGERAALRARFGFDAAVAVEALVPGSPGDAAAVRAGDSLVAVAGRRLAGGAAGAADRDAALDAIAAAPAAAPLPLGLLRGGVERQVVLNPVAACRATIEAVFGGGLAARADGRHVQIGDGFLARYADAEVAVVVAHELAHIVLRHHVLLAGHERDAALVRETEDAADALSVVLLYNARFDPAAAARFWRTRGAAFEAGPLRRRRHAAAGDRAVALDRALAAIPPGAPRPFRPAGLP